MNPCGTRPPLSEEFSTYSLTACWYNICVFGELLVGFGGGGSTAMRTETGELFFEHDKAGFPDTKEFVPRGMDGRIRPTGPETKAEQLMLMVLAAMTNGVES